MKKIIIVIVLVLSLNLFGCENKQTAVTKDNTIEEKTTENVEIDNEEINDADKEIVEKQESEAQEEQTENKSNNNTIKKSTSDSQKNTNSNDNSNSTNNNTNNNTNKTISNNSNNTTNEEKEVQQYCSLVITCANILKHDNCLETNYQIPNQGIICSKQVKINSGDSVLTVLRNSGVRIDVSGGYVKGIDNLYEFDCGDESGWVYSVNGVKPNVGAGKYEVKENDKIVWSYVVVRNEW